MLTYDLHYVDDVNSRRFRVITKPMTVRDGRLCDRMQADITRRKDESGQELDDYELLALTRYPVLFYGTHRFEVASLEGDEWGEWESCTLTEDLFWDLPEPLSIEWNEAVLEKNPHRNMTFENLKKFLEASFQPDSEPTLTEQPMNGKAPD